MSKVYYTNVDKKEIMIEGMEYIWIWGDGHRDNGDFEVTLKDGYSSLDSTSDGWLYVSNNDIIYKEEVNNKLIKDKDKDNKMTKVKITKEWAEVIYNMKKDNISIENALLFFSRKDMDLVTGIGNLDYNKLTTEQFALAYILGYEIEETPEQKLLDLYNYHYENKSEHSNAYLDGMMDTLHTLGIKIDGIEF